jgi:hypothetical protein
VATVKIYFDKINQAYTRPNHTDFSSPAHQVGDALDNPLLHVRPETLGKVKKETRRAQTSTVEDFVKPPEPIQGFVMQDNGDGSYTVSFEPRPGFAYEYQLDDGTWVKIPEGNNTFVINTDGLAVGEHTVNVREVNPLLP